MFNFYQIAPSIAENLTDVTSILNVADVYTGGLLGYGIWLIIFFGSIFSTSIFKLENSAIVSLLITTVASLFLWLMNLIGGWLVFMSVVGFAVSLLFARKNNSPV